MCTFTIHQRLAFRQCGVGCVALTAFTQFDVQAMLNSSDINMEDPSANDVSMVSYLLTSEDAANVRGQRRMAWAM
eukprot:273342-Chlamydomonas_euryale.AAC.8